MVPFIASLLAAACARPAPPGVESEAVPFPQPPTRLPSSPGPAPTGTPTPVVLPTPRCPLYEWWDGSAHITSAISQAEADAFIGIRIPPLPEGVRLEVVSIAFSADDSSAPLMNILSLAYDSARMFWIARDVQTVTAGCRQLEVIASMSPPPLEADEVVAMTLCTRVEGGETDTELIAVVPRPASYDPITDIRHLWRANTREGVFQEESPEGVFCYPDMLMDTY